jgi:hypothetical protein
LLMRVTEFSAMKHNKLKSSDHLNSLLTLKNHKLRAGA